MEETPDDTLVTWPVHIEVRLTRSATVRFNVVRQAVHEFMTTSFGAVIWPSTAIEDWQTNPILGSSVERIYASEFSCSGRSIPISQADLQIHVFQPYSDDTYDECTGGGDGEEEVVSATVTEMPSRSLEGLWESLIYSDGVKSKLLDYIYATIAFSDADVDFNVVSWNRVVLLHGPPGTGKTSLCRALAQKLSIRLAHKYDHARLLEINAHSLFSKWFSESGKLVQGLFGNVMEMIEEGDRFVVVLIDEVESLTAARAAAMAGTEPSDGLRVVNALLTQLDKLKHKKNVLVMATSNLPKAIDSAFVDRADIVQYIDLPPKEAIYQILHSCLLELIKRNLVQPTEVPNLTYANYLITDNLGETPDTADRSTRLAFKLMELAQRCRDQHLSGRALRKLPVLAYATYSGAFSQGVTSGKGGSQPGTPVETWLNAMEKIIDDKRLEREKMEL
ncbi:P-loop containing nucleoside triphosphate hydrolase protein [Thelephora terrestris]|uniref:P-loop containing nucleoside triphosphate hydrolase protein n=1 Tax=Thelephora terrestris TaxID=56493 RepID=A0A9P6H541_9AGAM|nr:P-loop containing nucleoside triphosphate hydrolase protein [Thelephora terrestris]